MTLPNTSRKELERRLSRVPGDPTPPPDLLRALKADIPADLGRPAAPPAPPWWQSHGLRAAAAVLLMVGAGIAALLFWPRVEMPEPQAASAPAGEAFESEGRVFADADMAEQATEERAEEAAEETLEASEEELPEEPSGEARDEATRSLLKLGSMGGAQRNAAGRSDDVAMEVEAVEARPAGPPPPQPKPMPRAKPAPPAPPPPPPARPAPVDGEDITLQLTESLPEGRSYQGYLQLTPGILPSNPAGEVASTDDFEGTSTDDFYYFEGIDVAQGSAEPEPALEPQATIEDEIRVIGEAVEVISEGTTSAQTVPGAAEPDLDPTSFAREVSDRPFIVTRGDRFSTFGLDVDTGSYTLSRRYLTEGRLPPPKVLRVEEWINAVDMGDPAPAAGATFAFTVEGAGSPFGGSWSPFGNDAGHRYFLRLGLKAREVAVEDRPPVALTFLVDTSGSMNGPDRLGLIRQALAALPAHGRPGDTVAVVRYGSEARVDLPPTEDLSVLPQVAADLKSDGSTYLEAGLRVAYALTAEHFRPDADHRIVLLSDGVANTGATEVEALLESVEEHADRGIELTVVGLGMGDYRDDLLEQLADRGDGRYAYVDRLSELETLFVEELHGVRRTVAEDAKMQIEWNPAAVLGYRLLGYENRDIADHEFRFHRTDGGEVGAGHAVSALYEIILAPTVPPGRTLGTWRLRYRDPDTGRFVEEQRRMRRDELIAAWSEAPATLRFSAEIAETVHLLQQRPAARVRRLENASRRLDEIVHEPAREPSVANRADTADGTAAPVARPLRAETRSKMEEMAELVARAAEVAAAER